VVGHGREAVTEHLAELSSALGRDVRTAVQEKQLGTGHAVSCALEELGSLSGTVLVTYGDVPLLDSETLEELLAEHRRSGNAVTVLSAVVDDPTGYGRIIRNADGQVTGIVEQKDATAEQDRINEINSGVYAFDAPVLADALQQLSTDNAQGELYLTDVLGIARAAGRPVAPWCAATPGSSKASTTGCSWPGSAPSSTGGCWSTGCAPGSPSSTPARCGWTAT